MNHNVSIWYAEHLLCHPQRGGTHRLRTTDLASWELKVCMFSLWSRSWSIGNVSVDARKRVKPVKYQTGQIWPLSQEWENQVLGFHLNFCIPTPWIPQKQTSNSAVYTSAGNRNLLPMAGLTSSVVISCHWVVEDKVRIHFYVLRSLK